MTNPSLEGKILVDISYVEPLNLYPMAEIEKRGYFDFEFSTPSYKKIKCIMKDGSIVTANFNRLQITYIGTVRIWIEELNKFITIQQILPSTSPEDEKYYDFISKEIQKISLKRKSELKECQKKRRKAA